MKRNLGRKYKMVPIDILDCIRSDIESIKNGYIELGILFQSGKPVRWDLTTSIENPSTGEQITISGGSLESPEYMEKSKRLEKPETQSWM